MFTGAVGIGDALRARCRARGGGSATHCLDPAAAVQTRLDKCQGAARVTPVISAPLLVDDAETMIGRCFVVMAGARANVEAINCASPVFRVDLQAIILIRPVSKRVDNRS